MKATSENSMSWHEANQAHLMYELSVIRDALDPERKDRSERSPAEPFSMEPAPALDRLCRAFNLSQFEKEILLLCAGVELDGSFPQIIGGARGDSRQNYPTFGLTLSALSAPHWSAISPAGPLRRWRLIEVTAAESLVNSRIRIDERVLHFLTGLTHLDDRLSGLVEPVSAPADLPPSHRAVARAIAGIWASSSDNVIPVVQLSGDDAQSKRDIAAAACAQVGLDLHATSAHLLPSHPAELDAFLRLWQRESILTG